MISKQCLLHSGWITLWIISSTPTPVHRGKCKTSVKSSTKGADATLPPYFKIINYMINFFRHFQVTGVASTQQHHGIQQLHSAFISWHNDATFFNEVTLARREFPLPQEMPGLVSEICYWNHPENVRLHSVTSVSFVYKNSNSTTKWYPIDFDGYIKMKTTT